jgi:hypothetical protein
MSEMSLDHENWVERPDGVLPAGLLEVAEGGTISPELGRTKVRMTSQRFPDGKEVHFAAHLSDTLGRVFEEAAQALAEPLLPPPPQEPLDLLRMRRQNGSWSDPISDFDLPLWKALADGFTRHVSVEYRLEVRINTKWGVASAPELTPRVLLTEFGFDPSQFTLYKPGSTVPLPPDTPIKLQRGEHFEAQKDGRYGGALSPSAPPRGLQTIEDDVDGLRSHGAEVRLHVVGSQKYVEAKVSRIPSSWSKNEANILIAVPANYPQGGLDAFYLEQGVHQNGSVPRQQATVQLLGRTWGLISWHYAANRQWDSRVDDLGSHIEHCRGFFLARGVVAQ